MISENTAFIFAHAFEMVLTLFLIVILARALHNEFRGIGDVIARFKRMARLDFQGGPYDMLVALFVLTVGMFIRVEAAWEWRFLELPLSIARLSLGVFLKGLATFCLIRLLMPSASYNRAAFTLLIVAVGFALFCALL